MDYAIKGTYVLTQAPKKPLYTSHGLLTQSPAWLPKETLDQVFLGRCTELQLSCTYR